MVKQAYQALHISVGQDDDTDIIVSYVLVLVYGIT